MGDGGITPIGRDEESFVSKFRYYIVFLSVCFAFCSLGGRLVWLQVLSQIGFQKSPKLPVRILQQSKQGVAILLIQKAIYWQQLGRLLKSDLIRIH